MSFNTQEQRVDYLARELCKDSIKYKDLCIENLDKRILMRSLMNIRMPKPMSNEFLKIQDEFLKRECIEKGITRLDDIPNIRERYGVNSKYADKISIWKGDITTLKVDAIVNAANSQMLGCFIPGHNCIDNAIHSAAGIQLRDECNKYMLRKKEKDKYYKEQTGQAMITKAYNLPSNYVIHTVGPIVTGSLTEYLREELALCYKSCLNIAIKNNIKSIAFCCISTGEFHFPNKEAAKISINTVKSFFNKKDNFEKIDRIIFNVFKGYDHEIYKKLLLSKL